MLVVTKLFNIAVNDLDAKKSAHYSRARVVTKLLVNGTQCNDRNFGKTSSLHRILIVTEFTASGTICKDPFISNKSKKDFARCEWALNIAQIISFPVSCEI